MMRAMVAAVVLLAALLCWQAMRQPGPENGPRANWDVASVLGEDGEDFAIVDGSTVPSFPADHGPHPEFRTEWWYFTGHLYADSGRRFGYQLTFFRSARPPRPADQADSAWSSDQVALAHFALTDLENEKFYASERFSRYALGLAGANQNGVWLEDWRLTREQDSWSLQAEAEDYALDLQLSQHKPPVLQGERGYSRKGPDSASYYYSLTRMPSRGEVMVNDEKIEVEGSSWMDHEWSSRTLGDHLAGWDWFALQLEDGRELMAFRLRRKDGAWDPFNSGSLVSADGQVEVLAADDFQLEETSSWTSPHTGLTYPAGWRLTLPGQELEFTIKPALADQELQVSLGYWEGTVDVGGSVAGVGYVELVGYGGTEPARSGVERRGSGE